MCYMYANEEKTTTASVAGTLTLTTNEDFLYTIMETILVVYLCRGGLPELHYMTTFKMLKDVGMTVPKSVEARKHPHSKARDDGMHQ